MTTLWKAMLHQLESGLSEAALQQLRALGHCPDSFPRSGLAKFAARQAASASKPPRFVLRVRAAAKVRWGHDGVATKVACAILEANGLPIAVIKLASKQSHKKGYRFTGCRKLRLRFDHVSAAKGNDKGKVPLTKLEAP